MTSHLKTSSSLQRTQFTAPTRGSEVRAAALVAGIGLVLMAFAAPAAAYDLVPAGRTGLAAVLLFGVLVLDVVVALALVPVLSGGGRAPAWVDASGAVTSACAVVGEIALNVGFLVRTGRS